MSNGGRLVFGFPKRTLPGPNVSQYLRTTSLLRAEKELHIATARIRTINSGEAQAIALDIHRRNVFARHSWENNFYVKRAKELEGRTVIEFEIKGDPRESMSRAQARADQLERLALISTVFSLNRRKFLKYVGPAIRKIPEYDLMLGPNFRYIRSHLKQPPTIKPLVVNDTFVRSFKRSGLALASERLLTGNSEILKKVDRALVWLLQSRFDTSLESALVKTAIALETLLVVSTSEPLGHTLSERIAFLLARTPEARSSLARVVKNFYSLRSGIVHGGTRKKQAISDSVVDSMNRLATLCSICIATNADRIKRVDGLREWVESARWGRPAFDLTLPFSNTFVKQAMKAYPSKHTP